MGASGDVDAGRRDERLRSICGKSDKMGMLANAIRRNDPGTEVPVLLVRQAATAFVMLADAGAPIEPNADGFPTLCARRRRPPARAGRKRPGPFHLQRVADMRGFSLSVSQPYGRFTKAFVLRCPLCELAYKSSELGFR